MKLIFLDIDGVLNAHEKLPSGYCGIARPCVDQLNRILAAVPDAQLVISSAWRYLILNQMMTLVGFECLLLTHGVCCHKRIFHHTPRDPDEKMKGSLQKISTAEWDSAGYEWRRDQIQNFIIHYRVSSFVVLDDLPLSGLGERFVRTDGKVGLTAADADRAIAMLSPAPCAPSKPVIIDVCSHENLDMDGICKLCGADRRGICGGL